MATSIKSSEYLRYFEGGRTGVQRRFLDAISLDLRKLLDSGELADFQAKIRVDDFVIRQIFDRNCLIVDSELVNKLCDELGICKPRCLGRLDIPSSDLPKLYEQADSEGFHPITCQPRYIGLYVRIKALEEL